MTSDSDGALVIFPPGTVHEQPLIVRKSDGGFGYDSTDMAAVWYRLSPSTNTPRLALITCCR